MIGPGYWSTGIVLRWYSDGIHDKPCWSIKLDFLDSGFCDQASTEGELRLRYLTEDVERGIDTLKADAERLGIRWHDATVYMVGDGEWEKDDGGDPYEYPAEWRSIVNEQARRLGWRECYSEVVGA